MSYEYKDIFIESLSNFIYPGKIFEESLSELDEVYGLAEIATQHLHNLRVAEAKADEYEAKARAFDRIVKESKGTFSCGDFCDDVRHIINSYEIGVAKDD